MYQGIPGSFQPSLLSIDYRLAKTTKFLFYRCRPSLPRSSSRLSGQEGGVHRGCQGVRGGHLGTWTPKEGLRDLPRRRRQRIRLCSPLQVDRRLEVPVPGGKVRGVLLRLRDSRLPDPRQTSVTFRRTCRNCLLSHGPA